MFGANPFGLHHFEGKPEGAGSIEIPAGGAMRFRYRIFFHRGSPEEAQVSEQYQRFATDESGWR